MEPSLKKAKWAVVSGEVGVHACFDSGNIICESVTAESVEVQLTLSIREDPFTEGTDKTSHFQWFHFRVTNVANTKCSFSIVNAGKSSYPDGWKGYKTCVSYDCRTWGRVVSTTYDAEKGALNWSVTFGADNSTAWFAYFAPYSYQQHEQFVARCSASPFAQLQCIGSSVHGRPLDMIVVTENVAQWRQQVELPKFWLCARQHPGETMAEWLAEGFLERLLCPDDALAKLLRRKAVFFVVPCLNPDGSVLGHLRTNATGANLNREWADFPSGEHKGPDLQRSPEVFHVLKALDEIGCNGYLDVHGDENIEGNFLCAETGVPNWSVRLQSLHDAFEKGLLRANPDFQNSKGYPPDAPGSANLAICGSQITARFNCFASTLEQPFKDTADEFPQPCGWSPNRSRMLGATLLGAWAELLECPDLILK